MLLNVARPSSTAATMVSKPVVEQHQVGRLTCDVGPRSAHGHPDVRRAQRRTVVDPVPRHRHHVAARLQGHGDPQLVLGRDPCDDHRPGPAAHRARPCRSGRSRPSSTGPSWPMMPTSAAMVRAVPGWSPVSRAIRMPARRQATMASPTPGRGGSSRPTSPSSSRSRLHLVGGAPGAPDAARRATARTRSPRRGEPVQRLVRAGHRPTQRQHRVGRSLHVQHVAGDHRGAPAARVERVPAGRRGPARRAGSAPIAGAQSQHVRARPPSESPTGDPGAVPVRCSAAGGAASSADSVAEATGPRRRARRSRPYGS